MRRNTIILYQLTLDFRIYIPFSGFVGAEVAENELCAFLCVILTIVISNHLGTVARFVIRIILITGVNHTHIKSHLAGIVRGNEHLRLFLSLRQRCPAEYCGVATLGKLHQFLDEGLLLWCRRDIVKNLVLHRSVNTYVLGGTVIRYLIVECRKLRHLDKVAETLLCHYMICDIKLKIRCFLGEDCRPCVEATDVLSFQLIRTEILE